MHSEIFNSNNSSLFSLYLIAVVVENLTSWNYLRVISRLVFF